MEKIHHTFFAMRIKWSKLLVIIMDWTHDDAMRQRFDPLIICTNTHAYSLLSLIIKERSTHR